MIELAFSNANYLYLLFLLPLVVLIHFYALKARRKYALRISNFEAIAKIKGIDLYSKNLVVLPLAILIVAFIILSLAGARVSFQDNVSSSSFVVAIDASKSMEATDIMPTRIEGAKEAVLDFIGRTPEGTRLGVISFSGNSIVEQDITDDKALAAHAVQLINISILGGTDLYDAISTSCNMLGGETFKTIILLSDGQFNVGTIQEAINYAAVHHCTVHTIAIGTSAGGETSFGISHLDEQTLSTVANSSNGRFFQVESKDALSASFDDILNIKKGTRTIELAPYLLVAALLIFIVEFILANTRYRIFP